VSLAVHYWTEVMNQDETRAVDNARAEALKHELTRFMDNVLHGRSDTTNSLIGSTIRR